MKKVHFYSGLLLSLFVIVHLFNHLLGFFSIDWHIAFMDKARLFYQNSVIEPLLLLAILVQIISGVNLVWRWGLKQKNLQAFLHVYSGLYLAFFLFAHTSATLAGRFLLQVDTNFYFAATVVNVYPYYFIYVPYYFLGVFAFFVHIGCIIHLKMHRLPKQQKQYIFVALLSFGGLVGVIILMGLMNNIEFPPTYQHLIDTYMK